MRLFGYGEEREPCCAEHDWRAQFTVDRLARGFRVDREHAARTLREFLDFRPAPASVLAVDGSGLLGEVSFWASHLCPERPSAQFAAVFGVGREVFRDDRWPVFTVELPSGAVLLVVYRSESSVRLARGCVVEPDVSYWVDLWLAPADGGPGLGLAELSGSFRGPGLRWPELREIARAALPDRVAAARRLLLLVPFLGDVDAGPEAVNWLARAVELVCGWDRRSAEVRSVAGVLAEAEAPVRWSLSGGVWVGDGEYCERNPGREFAVHPWSREVLRRVDVALGDDSRP